MVAAANNTATESPPTISGWLDLDRSPGHNGLAKAC